MSNKSPCNKLQHFKNSDPFYFPPIILLTQIGTSFHIRLWWCQDKWVAIASRFLQGGWVMNYISFKRRAVFHQLVFAQPSHPEALWWAKSPDLPIRFYFQGAGPANIFHRSLSAGGVVWTDASGAEIGGKSAKWFIQKSQRWAQTGSTAISQSAGAAAPARAHPPVCKTEGWRR